MSSDTDTPPNLRLQRLRVAVKLMLLLAFLIAVYVGGSSFNSNGTDTAELEPLSIDLDAVASGGAVTVNWNGRPIIIVQRTTEEIQALQKENSRLKDASSSQSEQPDFARVPHRSLDPRWFVAVALGTDFSCPVDRVQMVPATLLGVDDQAGLQDSCRGSYYDLAGRVIAGQYADRNLPIPEYQISGNTLILGGQ